MQRQPGCQFRGARRNRRGNRALEGRDPWRPPVYVLVASTVLQYDAELYRGTFDFLSAAGCDEAPAGAPSASSVIRRVAVESAGGGRGEAPVPEYYADDDLAPDAETYPTLRHKRAG
ncbi:MAG: hypothetical protein ACR2HN_05105 [Tepidiformaceae bacterium]